jgi:PIN domain nuclease of toxin-antitoxin system
LTLRAVADTHAVIWYVYDDPRLSPRARALIEEAAAAGDEVGFSAITLVEILYLTERGRIQPRALEAVSTAIDAPDAVLRELPLDRTIVALMPDVRREDVPELPDRIIAATARRHEVPLISRDREIRATSLVTVW